MIMRVVKKPLIVPLSFLILLLLGCNEAIVPKGSDEIVSESTPSIADQKIANDIKKAVAEKDFRLYVTSGRRVTIVGIEATQHQFVQQKCGTKPHGNTGDVLRSAEDKTQRKQLNSYLVAYNQKMLDICQKNFK